jgi:hypothetical protein
MKCFGWRGRGGSGGMGGAGRAKIKWPKNLARIFLMAPKNPH